MGYVYTIGVPASGDFGRYMLLIEGDVKSPEAVRAETQSRQCFPD